MKYNFDEEIDRRGTYSLKWDVPERELPMWVADMDFKTSPKIRQAIAERVEHGVFGYSVVPKEWNEAYVHWWEKRHHFHMEEDWLVFCTGIVPAISSIVRKLTTPNEKVLIQTPVYNIFFNSIINNGARVLESPLVYKNGVYEVDFADLERKLSDPQTTLMILCNPHNPIGKIWNKQTLERIGALAAKHHVIVVSDEIHCDLTDPGKEYIPFASVSDICRDNSITCMAPTKTFNLAGLQTAAVCIPNPVIRHKVWRGLNTDEVAEPNAFAMAATIAAFEHGEEWLEELRNYIYDNKQYAEAFLRKELPMLHLVSSEATYLLWIDCGKVGIGSEELANRLRETTGLYLCEGVEYGLPGDSFLRMNIACPRIRLADGLARLQRGIHSIGKI